MHPVTNQILNQLDAITILLLMRWAMSTKGSLEELKAKQSLLLINEARSRTYSFNEVISYSDDDGRLSRYFEVKMLEKLKNCPL